MRSLILAFETPVPPHGGSRLRMLHLARQLARVAQVDVAALGPVPAHGDEPFSLTSLRHTTGRARALASSLHQPYLAARYASRPAATLARTGQWDVVQASSAWLVREALAGGAPVVLDAHNVELEIVRTLARGERRPVHRLRWQWEAAKTARAEGPAVAAADVVAACSQADADALSRAGARRTIVVANGVDAAGVAHRLPGEGATLLYVGQLGYRPNETAAIELLEEILPRVAAAVPGVTARVVGRDTPESLRRRAGPNVEIAGEVPDVVTELHRASALVVPLRAGSGTRLKILEAMAAGAPVVSTPLGAAGIDAVDGRHLLLGETAAELAAQAVRLFTEPGLAAALSQAARQLVEQRYDWSITSEPLLEVHQELATRHRRREGRG